MSLTMYDDINLNLIPASAEAVAGYVNGRWPTYKEVVRRWPKAHHLSIAVTSHVDADCLDVEPGDATNVVAPGWVKRQIARGVHRPVVYTSVSNAAALLRALAHAGIQRSQIRLWTAHYTHREHLCGPSCGFGLGTTADATQWTDKALGRSLDQSLCSDSFFATAPKPQPTPKPKPRPKLRARWQVTITFYDGRTKVYSNIGSFRLWTIHQANFLHRGVVDIHAHKVQTG